MHKLEIFLGILMIIFVGTLVVITFKIAESPHLVSGSVKWLSKSNLPYTHSYTKAICDENNHCKDYEIFCKNNEIIEMRFTGAAIQFSKNWEDPREEVKNDLC